MSLKDIIFELSSASGVNGLDGALDVARQLLKPLGETKADDMGGVCCVIGNGNRRVMLDAHIDEIGFVVTAVDGSFLRVAKCGGIDVRTVINQTVTIHGKKPVKGVFASMPPHLRADQKKAPDIDSLVIDCGLTAERLSELVRVGDRVSFDCEPCELLNGRITGKSLDNRVGVAAVIEAAKRIAKATPDCTLIVSLSSQEELGLRGARTLAYSLEPQEAIVVDVSFGDGQGMKPQECGKLSGGVMIGVSPILNRPMTDKMFAICNQNNIPHQTEAMGGSTGTNADVITISRSGVKCALLSIPLRNMHTCCELVDLKDVESVIDLMTAYVCAKEV